MDDIDSLRKAMSLFRFDAHYTNALEITCMIIERDSHRVIDAHRGTKNEIRDWLKQTWPGVYGTYSRNNEEFEWGYAI